MLRALILAIARRPALRRLFTGGAGRRLALRFVAGERLEDAVDVVRGIVASGAAASLDYLGEGVAEPATAHAAAAAYLKALDRLQATGPPANVSVKLTQMGLDLDPDLAFRNAEMVVRRAAETGSSVTLDMEDHRYTERTIETCLRLAERQPGRVGVALQAMLHRTPADLERLVEAGVGVRLCKGAYLEPRDIAERRREKVRARYARLLVRLLEEGAGPMIATHDERLVRFAQRRARELGREPGSFEFQMLYGVRRELQQQIVAEGHRLRVYVPFGTQWYPYLTRRIAERPANLRFFVEALLRR